jgi:hypothetical protein
MAQAKGAVPSNPQALPWRPGFFRLVGSHITADKAVVAQVKRHLAQHGIDLLVAHHDIKPTSKWEAEIELALTTCDALAAFLTEGSMRILAVAL